MIIKQPLSLNDVKKLKGDILDKNLPPLNIEIETDARCNRQCSYCPVAYNEKRKGQMEISFFESIMKQLVELNFKGHLGFHFYNEPLLDERLETFITVARKYLKTSVLYVITNGDLLSEERAKALLDSGLDYIRVSVHDEKLENKIKKLLTILDLNYSQKIVAYNYYKGERVMTTRSGTIDIDKSKFEVASVIGGCIWSTRMVIAYDGKVPLCCDDFHNNYSLGDLTKQSLKEIWEASYLKREKIFKGNFELSPCLKCLENSNS